MKTSRKIMLDGRQYTISSLARIVRFFYPHKIDTAEVKKMYRDLKKLVAKHKEQKQ